MERLVLLGTILLSFGCSKVETFDRIDLERTGCYGSCPSYRLTIFGDGRVEYEGHKWVEVRGERSTRIGPDGLKPIVATINDIGFFNLRSRYRYLEDGCPGVTTCGPTATVTVQAEGRKKTVEHYHGCYRGTMDDPVPYPQDLFVLENLLDQAARTERWIGEIDVVTETLRDRALREE